jgi:plastocyanin
MKKTLTPMLTLIALSATVLSFAPSARAITYEVEIEDFTFVPGRLHIDVGDAIEWRNRDNALHSATSDEGIWDSGLLARDQTFTFTFTTAGVYPYHC